jgi:hypothetical protein
MRPSPATTKVLTTRKFMVSFLGARWLTVFGSIVFDRPSTPTLFLQRTPETEYMQCISRIGW